MKTRTLIQAAVVAAIAAAPALSFAQNIQQAPKTRAEVRQELIQVEQAGYDPARSDNVDYPSDIQAAEARVHQQQGTADTGYGPATSGTTQSGPASQMTTPSNSLYQGH